MMESTEPQDNLKPEKPTELTETIKKIREIDKRAAMLRAHLAKLK